ncbi:hypothetical protein V3C99_000977 [Haemonchus contortus]
MALLFVLLLASTVSGKSLDLTKVNVDDLPSDAQKPVFPGAPSNEADDENFDEADNDVFEEVDDEFPDGTAHESADDTNDEPSDDNTPTESSEATEVTKEAAKCVDKPK